MFWVRDKAIGGKIFGMMNPECAAGEMPMSYAAGEERFAELVERDGIRPAPYFARIFWVSAERWDVFREREWEEEFRAAHGLVFAKLPAKVKAVLAMPKGEQKKIVAERRKLLAAKAAAKKA